MKKIKFLLTSLFVLLSFIAPAMAQEVNIGLYVLNLGKFDISTGSFTADFYISMKCSQTCPQETFEFINGRAGTIDKIINKPKEKFYRIQANLNSPVDLKKFPFDTQKMQIIIEDKNNDIQELQYTSLEDESGIDDSIIFSGWNIDGWNAEAREHNYAVYNETFSQYVFNIEISRIVLNSFMKTFLPVIFILLIVLLSLILDPDKMPTRLTMAGSSLVAAVMFHVSISNQIPPVGYLTFADKFMILTYFILLLVFLIDIILIEFLELKKTKLVEKIHRSTEYSMLIAVPLLYILLFVFFT